MMYPVGMRSTGRLLAVLWLSCMTMIPAASAAFTDVERADPARTAIDFLVERGVLKGYADGSFRPLQPVTRAEAVTMLIRTLFDRKYINAFAHASTSFKDVPLDAWYLPSLEIARQHQAVRGPPEALFFYGQRQVTLAEFTKMLLILGRENTRVFETQNSPLASDVTDATAWYYPYLAAGMSRGVVVKDDEGKLQPNRPLSRSAAALLLYRYLQPGN